MDSHVPQSLTLKTVDGERLEAEAFIPPHPRMAVVITHPHPLAGGNMRTPVPANLFKRASGLDCAALRFNFRGVGASTGVHDEGRAEKHDVAAAIETVTALAPDIPVLLAGWSFGADVILTSIHPAVTGWFSVAPPLSVVPVEEFAASGSQSPKTLVVPEHDQYRAPAEVRELTAAWLNTRQETLEGADHFMAGALGATGDLFETVITRLS